ncbi:Uncharacterised protein [Mycobacteroides abscessus subsp. abscessus]|nr:Uncharacterised protein [Mycobacteroides abscessus subsp. abscessus]
MPVLSSQRRPVPSGDHSRTGRVPRLKTTRTRFGHNGAVIATAIKNNSPDTCFTGTS